MPTITEKIVLAREARDEAEKSFREALRAGRDNGMSWAEIANVAGMTKGGVRWIALNLNDQRVARKKEAA